MFAIDENERVLFRDTLKIPTNWIRVSSLEGVCPFSKVQLGWKRTVPNWMSADSVNHT